MGSINTFNLFTLLVVLLINLSNIKNRIKMQLFKVLWNTKNRTWGYLVRSANADSVICRPQMFSFEIFAHQLQNKANSDGLFRQLGKIFS